MELHYKKIDDTKAFEAFSSLLNASNLPTIDLNYERDLLVGYYEGNELVGTGALEIHGDFGLLRSLSVKLGIRGKSVGSTITEFLLNEGRKKKLKGIYLLTETARGFFQKKGFKDVPRLDVPDDIKASTEFSSVCPTSATVMYLPTKQ
jgi:amino-acid N-acetyltransferase